jgi:hypothetical protein
MGETITIDRKVSNILRVEIDNDTGSDNDDYITNDGTMKVKLPSTAVAGDVIKLYADDAQDTLIEAYQLVEADIDNRYAYIDISSKVSDGWHEVYPTIVDQAGNESSIVTFAEIKLDRSINKPVITAVNNQGDEDTSSISIIGTAEAGATVEIYAENPNNGGDSYTKIGDVTLAEGETEWTFNRDATEGYTYNYKAKAIDVAGNESDLSDDYVQVSVLDNGMDSVSNTSIEYLFDDGGNNNINLGGALNHHIEMMGTGDSRVTTGSGNDMIRFNDFDSNDTVNGGSHGDDTTSNVDENEDYDTLSFNDGDNTEETFGSEASPIDMGALLANVSNIEKIDTNDEDTHILSGIDIADVISITDSDNELHIDGDNKDSLELGLGDDKTEATLINNSGVWHKDTENANTYITKHEEEVIKIVVSGFDEANIS